MPISTPCSSSCRSSRGLRSTFKNAVIAAALCAAAGWALPARGQTLEAPRHRQGYYFAAGYQVGATKIWEDGESWNVWPSSDFAFRMGELLTRRLGLGLQLVHVGSARGQDQRATLFGLALEAQWEIANNVALVGGIGFDVITLSTTKPSTIGTSSRGTFSSGYSLAVTYDWFLGNRLTGGWSLAPILQARLVPGNGTSALVGTLGAQLCFWSGRPRNQLDLPPDKAFEKP